MNQWLLKQHRLAHPVLINDVGVGALVGAHGKQSTIAISHADIHRHVVGKRVMICLDDKENGGLVAQPNCSRSWLHAASLR